MASLRGHTRSDVARPVRGARCLLRAAHVLTHPGGHSGWHSHPGPVFIQVVSGTMTFARNETNAPAVNLVTYFAPPGAALRNDEPRPGNCPF
jgi:quercetin dioxygenase-like cupin family protein